jgi:hypothetical protein
MVFKKLKSNHPRCPMMTDVGLDRGNTSILASGDESGIFMLWDMRTAKVLHYFGFILNFNKKIHKQNLQC